MKTRRISFLLFGSIALTAISALLTYYAISDSRHRLSWVFHTYEVIEQSTALLSLLKDAETGQRGYLITGDSVHLDSYHFALQRVPILVDSLRNAVSDNGPQATLLNRSIGPFIALKFRELQRMIDIRNRYDTDTAFAYFSLNRGKIAMDSLRHLLSTFTDREKALLADRLQMMSKLHQRQAMLRYGSFLLIGSISFLAFISIARQQRRNNALIRELHETNQSLDQKIQERTRELEIKQEQTRRLNIELTHSLEEVQSFYDALQIRYTKTEDTLHEIRTLYNDAPSGYHSLDENGIVIRINNTELRWLGYERDEVIGKMNFTDFIIPDEIPVFQNLFQSFKAEGSIRNIEHTFKRKDGSTFPVLINATALFDIDHRYIMSRTTVVDITEVKQIEEKLVKANQELIDLNAEKNHFLRIAAHDLKSPLNGIMGLLNLFKYHPENLTHQQLEYIQYIGQACADMSSLINNLLDIDRIEQGLNIIKPERIILRDLLQHHLKEFEPRAAKKQITLTLEDQTSGLQIVSDVTALKRTMENLISNAIKFSPYNKNVIIRVSSTETKVTIQIIDDGQGIKKEDIPMLFKKYQRLSARPTGGESSTGLGLSIVKELVTSLSGKIYVESEYKKGTTFTIELPLEYGNSM